MNKNKLINLIDLNIPLTSFDSAGSTPQLTNYPSVDQPDYQVPRSILFVLVLAMCFIALVGCGSMQKTQTPVVDREPGEPESQITTESSSAETSGLDHCSGRPERLQPKLQSIAGELSGIMYKTPYRDYILDCSGMFHRVLEEVAKICPNLSDQYPDRKRFRTTRQLARWYYDRNQLTIVRDIDVQSKLIKPGVVMFYGKHGKTYRNPSIEKLVKDGVGIEHMGVVVEVEKDSAGRVTNYHLFHGQRTGKRSATTKRHFRNRSSVNNGQKYHPLGNWKQQLVAIAPLIKSR